MLEWRAAYVEKEVITGENAPFCRHFAAIIATTVTSGRQAASNCCAVTDGRGMQMDPHQRLRLGQKDASFNVG